VAVLVGLSLSCRTLGHLHRFPACADGLPVQVLIDAACPPDGVCGYSCLPGRWRAPRPIPTV
jgi:hypothetical protein